MQYIGRYREGKGQEAAAVIPIYISSSPAGQRIILPISVSANDELPRTSFSLYLLSSFVLLVSSKFMDTLRISRRTARYLRKLNPSNPLSAFSSRPNTPFHQIHQPGIVKRTMASAMAKRLEGKTIVVTGASAGIGKSTAKEFARTSPKNLKIILTARRIDSLNQIAQEIKEEVGDGVKVLPVKMDVSNPEEVKNFVPSLPAEFREIDVLVNNA